MVGQDHGSAVAEGDGYSLAAVAGQDLDLFVVEEGVDYTRFDRFHVNVAADGTAVDEVMQILAGGGVRILQRLPDEGAVTLTLDCPSAGEGWTVTYDGAVSHIGSMSAARPGTKALMQVFGPARWTMRYDSG